MVHQWPQAFLTIDHPIGPSDDARKPVKSDAVAGSAGGQFVQSDDADAAGDGDLARYDRLADAAPADDHVLIARAQRGVDQRGDLAVDGKTIGDQPDQLLAKFALGNSEDFANSAADTLLSLLQLCEDFAAFGDALKSDFQRTDFFA